MNVGTKPRFFCLRISEYSEFTGRASITKLDEDGSGSVGTGVAEVVVEVVVVLEVVLVLAGLSVVLVRVLFLELGVVVVVVGAVVSITIGGVGSLTGLVATGLVGGDVAAVVPSGGSPKGGRQVRTTFNTSYIFSQFSSDKLVPSTYADTTYRVYSQQD